jgi:carbamoyltransferase
MEMGQRALGNRSILADPRDSKNIQKINKMIKNRDFWMPFAPIVLYEYQEEVIVNPKKIESPYMTIAFETKNREKIQAAIHQSDFTARPQILKKETNPILWDLIKCFYDETGVPALLNTSFNLHGEPIVRTISDAARVFDRTGLEVLWLDKHIIEKD